MEQNVASELHLYGWSVRNVERARTMASKSDGGKMVTRFVPWTCDSKPLCKSWRMEADSSFSYKLPLFVF